MDKKNIIKLHTQGVEGGNVSNPRSKGFIMIVFEPGIGDSIAVEVFDGYEDNRNRKEEAIVEIRSGSRTVFKGTYSELIDILKKETK